MTKSYIIKSTQLFLIIFCVQCLNWKTTFAQCNLPGLLHHYQFNNNLLDSVGNNHALGVISPGALEYTTDRFGVANNALLISLAGNPSVLPLTQKVNGNTHISISFWFKGDYTYNGFYSLVASNASNGYLAKYGDANIGTGVYHSFGAGAGYTTPGNYPTTGGITIGAWTHVAITRSAANITKIYYNGVQEGPDFTTGTMLDSIAYLFGYGGTGVNGFSPLGSIDDYKIFNYELSSTDVSNLYSFNSLSIATHPKSDTFCLNSSTPHYLFIGTQGVPDSIQWFKDGVALANTNNDTIFFNPISFADTGNYHAVVYNNYCGLSFTSNTASLRLRTLPIISATVQNPMNTPYSNLSNVSTTANNANGFLDRYNQSNTIGVIGKDGGFNVTPNWTNTSSAISFWYRYNSATTSNISYLLGVPSLGGNIAGFTPLAINTTGELGYVSTGSAFTGSGLILTNNQWYNFIINFIGNDREVYVNGVLAYTYTAPYNLQQEPITYVGTTGQGSTLPYRAALGNYDDVFFYNQILNSSQVTSIYNAIYLKSYHYQEICGNTLLMHFGSLHQSMDSNFTYQWYKNNIALNDNAHIWGTNTNFLWFDVFDPIIDTGIYKLIVSNGCLSNQSIFYYNYAPYITSNAYYIYPSQPINNATCSSITAIQVAQVSSTNPVSRMDYYNGTFKTILGTNYNTVEIPKTEAGRHVITYTYNNGCQGTLLADIVDPATVDTIFYSISNDDCNGDPSHYLRTGTNCTDSLLTNNTYNFIDQTTAGKIASITTLGASTDSIPSVTLYNEPPTATTILANTHQECNVPYMNKSWAINFEPALTKVKLYFTQADLDAMKAATGCTMCTYKDVILTQISSTNLSEINCDPNDNNSMNNYYIFWNKDSNNTLNEIGIVSNVYNNTPNALFGNISGNVLGACTSGTVPGGYYFEVITDKNSEFRLHLLDLGVSVPLSIAPLYLQANVVNNNAVLQWHTIDNANNYSLQKSIDGKVWTTISKINVDKIKESYTYKDLQVLQTNTTYRVIAKTKDDATLISNSVTVSKNNNNTTVTLFPNPSSDGFMLSNANNSLVEITDALGKTVYNKSYNNEKINTATWPDGVYFVLIKGKNRIEQVKFIKK